MNKFGLFFLFCLLFSCQQKEALLLHVPSPNWEDQVIYFLMTDRFADGNPENNDFGTNEYDPKDHRKFQGGDFVGIQQNLDYLDELGVDAIWFTPPVANQWWNPDTNFTGYHGYWASHFMETDPHFGTLQELKNLSDAIHQKGMYLIQDIVVNHTGNYFSYEGGYEAAQPTKYYTKIGAPTQAPFDKNDPNNPEHLAAEIYNFTPYISDYQDESQILTYQMGMLDDLKTTNPVVRAELIKAYQFWVKEAGLDGFRFDTPVYVEHDFFNAFMHRGQADLLGIEPFAKTLGKDFYTFGETWVSAKPFNDDAEIKSKAFIGTPEKPEMDGALNFPLQQTITKVIARGEPTAQLAYRLEKYREHYPNPVQSVNFIDNHDMPRFRSYATAAAYRQAMMLLMTLPGVPVIWQGTEQGCLEDREQMFDLLDTQSKDFQFVKNLIAFRKEQAATRSGKIEILADSKTCPGLLLVKLAYAEKDLYLAFNTLDEPILTNEIPIPTSNNEPVEMVEEFSLVDDWVANITNGTIDLLQLPPKAGLVFSLKPVGKAAAKNLVKPTINSFKNTQINQSELLIGGNLKEGSQLFLLIDGNLAQKIPVDISNTTWQAKVNLNNLKNGNHYIQAVESDPSGMTLSNKQAFGLQLPERLYASQADPIGDDLGPKGTYQYPIHETFNRQMDIKNVTVHTTGNNFRLDVEMVEPLTTVWNPTNGFDHVQLNIFIDLPNQNGATALPLINATMPEGTNWDYHATAAGWNTGMYNAKGAAEEVSGEIMPQKPVITTISEKNTIQLQFSANTIGRPTTLEGMNIFICTWDGGGYDSMRAFEKEPKDFIFGGYEEGAPIWMDEVWVKPQF